MNEVPTVKIPLNSLIEMQREIGTLRGSLTAVQILVERDNPELAEKIGAILNKKYERNPYEAVESGGSKQARR